MKRRTSSSKNLEKEVDRIGLGRGQQPRHLDLVLTPFSLLFYNHLQTEIKYRTSHISVSHY